MNINTINIKRSMHKTIKNSRYIFDQKMSKIIFAALNRLDINIPLKIHKKIMNGNETICETIIFESFEEIITI